MRFVPALAALTVAACVHPVTLPASQQINPATIDTADVRRELLQWYEENKAAFFAKDVSALMALRSEELHSVTPDGGVRRRPEMEQMTRAFLAGIDRWITQDIRIDSLTVSGDTARAIVHQHLVRMARRGDNQIHHVETWVTQRESWIKGPRGWKLYRVDNLRDQRRLIDGQPG
jgi:ketosteroid isomerase-like protein